MVLSAEYSFQRALKFHWLEYIMHNGERAHVAEEEGHTFRLIHSSRKMAYGAVCGNCNSLFVCYI